MSFHEGERGARAGHSRGAPRAQRSSGRALAMLVTAALATGGANCAQERAPINQVQPDFLDKSELIPVQYGLLTAGGRPGSLSAAALQREAQWYHQVTIIDKPPTTGRSGISSYTQVERIYWEVTEGMLIARQAYDRLRGGQNDPTRPSVANNPRQTEIVAAYPITSHFDVRRSYNTTTGEENNVVVENATDRPWHQRQFMRVDWSRNLVGSFNPLSGITGQIPAEPTSFNNTPDDPNRPVFDYGAFNGQPRALRYFDVTNRMILRPDQVFLEGLGNIQACLLYDRLNESCQPADVTMRVAFRRVDPSRDYQPLAMDGHRFDRFGFFEDRRAGFNPAVGGPGQAEVRHFANRHNLWMQHHGKVTDLANAAGRTLDHQAGDVACSSDNDCVGVSATARCDTGTRTCGEVYVRCAAPARGADEEETRRMADAQCAGLGAGAACDTDVRYVRNDGFGLCLLPYRKRTVRPIAYHLSQNYPERIMPVTRSLALEWNRVFRHAVLEARYRECLLDTTSGATAGSPAACAPWRDPNSERNRDARVTYAACHNPVWGTNPSLPGAHSQADLDRAREAGWDTEACGPQGTSARLGDLRYSMIASVNQYDANGPWGLAQITGDPSTGEVLVGRGAVWQTVTDSQAAFATDMIRILNGDVTPEEFAQGQTIIGAYDYIRANGAREERTGANVPLTPRPVHRDVASRAEVETLIQQSRMNHLHTVDSQQIRAEDVQRLSADLDGQPREDAFLRNLAGLYREQLPTSGATESPAARMASLRGTSLEASLMDREMLLAANADPTAPPSPAATERSSPFRQNDVQFRALQAHYQGLMEQHECRFEPMAFSDEVIAVMLHRFRRNQIPADVRFGETWNVHAAGQSGACREQVEQGNCQLNYAEILRYLEQYIGYGVMLHEIGHSVGERHNFMGSADALNYDDRYWQLRVRAEARNATDPSLPADQLRPRFEHMADGLPFYSPEEEREGVEEYGYSTVMEYKGWNEDAHGLGRYDRAFVMHGYVDLVESFDEVQEPATALNLFEGMTGGYQGALRITYEQVTGGFAPRTFHYTDIPRVVGLNARGLPNITDENRFPVFLRETTRRAYGPNWVPDHTNVALNGRDGRPVQGGRVLVPYMFNTDGYANSIWNNQRYDAGADMFESMRYVSQRYQDYYFTNAFSRGRANFNVNSYRGRMIGRYLDQAYYSMRGVAYITNIYQNLFGNQAGWQQVLESPHFRSSALGAATIVDMFVNAIVMPNASLVNPGAGRHCLVTRADGTNIWDRAQGNTCVDLPLGTGRDYQSQYPFGAGQYWREQIVNVGSFHDKSLSLDYLTDTFIWSPDRFLIEFQDPQRFQINLYTLYPGQTLRFFGSLLSRDHGDIGAQVRPRGVGVEPEIIRTRLPLLNLPQGTGVGQNGRDPMLRAIDPNLGFSLELQALTFLFGQLDAAFDRSARLSARLWREGDTWAVPTAPGRDMVSFTSPFTNLTYTAVHIGGRTGEPGANVGLSRRDEASNETGIAARMLNYANILANRYRTATGTTRTNLQTQLQAYIDLIERAREFSGRFN